MITQLYKLAYDLDKKGLYSEAEEIEEAMKLLVQRVGLKVEDLVALANFHDARGEYEIADQFDKAIMVNNIDIKKE